MTRVPSSLVAFIKGIHLLSIIFGSSLFALAGCSDQLATYPAKGIVRFADDGGVVHVGTVELKSREHGVQARGQIQTDGTFILTTYEPDDGAIAGLHDAVVVQFVMSEDVAGHRPSRIGVVDRRFASYATSGLEVDISSSEDNNLVIEVEGVLETQPSQHEHKK